jgi:hypothetical protein
MNLSLTYLQQQQEILFKFEEKILTECKPLMEHPLHYNKIEPAKKGITESKELLRMIISSIQQNNVSDDNELADGEFKESELRQRLIPAPTQKRTSDSDEQNSTCYPHRI